MVASLAVSGELRPVAIYISGVNGIEVVLTKTCFALTVEVPAEAYV